MQYFCGKCLKFKKIFCQDSESSRENSPNIGKKTENEYKNGNSEDALLSNTHAQWKKSHKPSTHSKFLFWL